MPLEKGLAHGLTCSCQVKYFAEWNGAGLLGY